MTDAPKQSEDDSEEDGAETGMRSKAERAAASYAWEYFKYHAQQRQAVFRFFLIIAGAMSAAYLLTYQEKADASLKYARPLLAAMLTVVCFLFWRLDVRSYQLVKIAEDYLKRDEVKLAAALDGIDEIRLIDRSNRNKSKTFFMRWFASFRLVYAWLFALIGLLGGGLLVVAVAPYWPAVVQILRSRCLN